MIKPRLRRLYVLLWVGWGLWWLYWPIYIQNQNWDLSMQSRRTVLEACLDSTPNQQRCRDEDDASFKRELEAFDVSPYKPWKVSVPLISGLMLIPPLIVYGLLFRAVPWLVRFVWEGWK